MTDIGLRTDPEVPASRTHPPGWVLGAAVPAVALNAASGLIPASWKRIGTGPARQARRVLYAVLGAAAAATVGAYLVLVLLALSVRSGRVRPPRAS